MRLGEAGGGGHRGGSRGRRAATHFPRPAWFYHGRRDARERRSIELARSTEEEKQSQLRRLADFHARNAREAPKALGRLKRVVIENGNVFAELMKTVRVCSLGQITKALFEVGGEYRRSM